jgi:hypothetical protein
VVICAALMLEKCCAVRGKNLPDTEKWLCSYCFVWCGLASMAQPVRPAAQALHRIEALTGLRRFASGALLAGSTVRTKFAASMLAVRADAH